jgi:hypothetical protein
MAERNEEIRMRVATTLLAALLGFAATGAAHTIKQ